MRTGEKLDLQIRKHGIKFVLERFYFLIIYDEHVHEPLHNGVKSLISLKPDSFFGWLLSFKGSGTGGNVR
jgi:hypothetical protein